ncbi:hypothetical protein GCM10017783_09870 [Deinococcus piscis]|uniref:N-acetyltransferase domain-containing protein n=1 Tax=Deinococcus piscis TaxID=394230 RepID=A0ABQ3K1I7_9DEIO|nr:GNAT family N-acetyltransferase [Deinococcus piscis]GHF99782.1 hypothetical protein GCM10017783_09870 [Deinococcus piscis]
MPFQICAAAPVSLLRPLAELYGCSEEDLSPTAPQLGAAWTARNSADELLGLLALRFSSPAYGAEVMGGVWTEQERGEVALALLRSALAEQPLLYAYADETHWPVQALSDAGLSPVSAYLQRSGPLPQLHLEIPTGFRLLPLSEVSDPADRWAAQEGYSDLIGHTHVTAEATAPNAAGSDDTLGCLAYSPQGTAVGVCRVWQEADGISLTTPAVRPEARGIGLREAMLAWVCARARRRGLHHITLESWGDSEADQAWDAGLGLTLKVHTPIYAPAR